jgi:hypothetical protein
VTEPAATPTTVPPTTGSRLLFQTAVALVFATAFTVLVALPAERGVDPTGFGKLTGLTRLAKPQTVQLQATARPAAAAAGASSPTPFLSDVIEIKLTGGGAEGSETERKVWMEAGQTLVYAWAADGEVYSDFHGETLPTPKVTVAEYRVTDPDKGADPRAANGALTAPMAGFHGWYFVNLGEKPVTIRVKIAGFYERRPYPPPGA